VGMRVGELISVTGVAILSFRNARHPLTAPA